MVHLYTQGIQDGIHKITYRGFPIQKFPFDYVLYQMIMYEVKPDLIIEIGTMRGGSALYLADLMDIMGIENGEIHTIDIVNFEDRKYREEVDFDIIKSNPRIKFFTGGFQNYDLSNCEGFKKILVIDDGSHIYEEVLEALDKFKDVVSIGSYFIVEDGNAMDLELKEELKKSFNGGPLRAISEFLRQDNGYTVDLRWCDMFGINSTFNTYGYLKKIR